MLVFFVVLGVLILWSIVSILSAAISLRSWHTQAVSIALILLSGGAIALGGAFPQYVMGVRGHPLVFFGIAFGALVIGIGVLAFSRERRAVEFRARLMRLKMQ